MVNENEKNKHKVIAKVHYGQEEIELYWQDLWFINYIRQIGHGTLADVRIQNGRVVLVDRCEKKIKPEMLQDEPSL